MTVVCLMHTFWGLAAKSTPLGHVLILNKNIPSKGSALMSQVSRQTSPDYYEKLPTRLSKLTTDADNYQSINNELRKPDADPDDLWYAMGTRLQKILHYRYYREGGYRWFS